MGELGMDLDLFEKAGVGLCCCNSDGRIISINNRAFSLLSLNGHFKKNNDVLNTCLFDHISHFRSLFENYNAKSANELEIKIKDSGNTAKYLKTSLLNAAENEYILVIDDISELKNIKKLYLESEEKLRTMLEVIPDIVYRVDTNGIITFISESVSRYGYNQEELIGTSILDLVHPDDRETAQHRILERRTGKRMTRFFEVRLITKSDEILNVSFDSESGKDSHFFSVCSEGVYRHDGKNEKIYIGTQGIYSDIEDKKQIEWALRRSEEKWISVMESIEDGYYEADIKGRILYVNRALSEKLGYPKEEIIGSPFEKFVDPEEKESVYSFFNKVYKSGKLNMLKNWTGVAKSGKKIHFEGSVSLIKTKSEGIAFFNGILRDISDKKKMEQELLMARKLEAIGILAGGIAHDYNNALTAIIGNLSLARMEIDQKNIELIDTINDAEKAALKVKELTHQLSTFSKGGKPVKKNTDLKLLISNICDPLLKRASSKCVLNISSDLWMVEVDEFQIGHVLEYIITNALEAMDYGGMLNIAAMNIQVENEEMHNGISLQEGKYVQIIIEDSGRGIDQDDISRIFDPYFTTKDMGSGMGLAISYAIVKRHKGYIDINSIKDKGTTVSLYLPVTA